MGSVRVTRSEDPQHLHHGPEITAGVRRGGVHHAQPRVGRARWWLWLLLFYPVRNARDGHAGIPRRKRLGKLVRVGNDPVGSSEDEALHPPRERAVGPEA